MDGRDPEFPADRLDGVPARNEPADGARGVEIRGVCTRGVETLGDGVDTPDREGEAGRKEPPLALRELPEETLRELPPVPTEREEPMDLEPPPLTEREEPEDPIDLEPPPPEDRPPPPPDDRPPPPPPPEDRPPLPPLAMVRPSMEFPDELPGSSRRQAESASPSRRESRALELDRACAGAEYSPEPARAAMDLDMASPPLRINPGCENAPIISLHVARDNLTYGRGQELFRV